MGPGSEDGIAGHIKKISALTVNALQPCEHEKFMICYMLPNGLVYVGGSEKFLAGVECFVIFVKYTK